MPGKYKILTVDDDTTNLILVKEILGKDYDVKTTSAGRQALEWLKTESFDLVITDKNMPDMDGRQLKAILKNRYPGMPVMLVTASFDEGSPNYSKARDFDAFLPKPLDINLLLVSARRLLKRTSPVAYNRTPYYNVDEQRATVQPTGAGAPSPGKRNKIYRAPGYAQSSSR